MCRSERWPRYDRRREDDPKRTEVDSTPDATLADLQQTVADLRRQLAEARAEREEALEQQTATAEVRQVINSSPSGLVLCRGLKLFTRAVVAIDGSKFKAVSNRDTGRMEQVDASIARYLRALDRADRVEGDVAEAKSGRLKEKIAGLRTDAGLEGRNRRFPYPTDPGQQVIQTTFSCLRVTPKRDQSSTEAPSRRRLAQDRGPIRTTPCKIAA
jgi:hypothetical protein